MIDRRFVGPLDCWLAEDIAADLTAAKDIRKGDLVWASPDAGWQHVREIRRARYFVAVWFEDSRVAVMIDNRNPVIVETPRPEPCP